MAGSRTANADPHLTRAGLGDIDIDELRFLLPGG